MTNHRMLHKYFIAAMLLVTCSGAYFVVADAEHLLNASSMTAKEDEDASRPYVSRLKPPTQKAGAAIPQPDSHADLRRIAEEQVGKVSEDIGQLKAPACDGSRLCQSMLSAPPPGAPEYTAGLNITPLSDELTSKIEKVSTTKSIVARIVVDELFVRLSAGDMTPRIVPEQQDGRVIGLRLFGIRPSSLMATLGLENGDRLEAINGLDLSTPKKALEAYASVRTANEIRLQINRRGRPLSVAFHIR